jgi:hypothetical protein
LLYSSWDPLKDILWGVVSYSFRTRSGKLYLSRIYSRLWSGRMSDLWNNLRTIT